MFICFLTLCVGLAYIVESIEWRFHSAVYEAWAKGLIAYAYIVMAYVKFIDYSANSLELIA